MTRLDIQTNVIRILKGLFPDIPVKSNDIREGMDIDPLRPCFFVDVVQIESGVRMVNYSQHRATVNITFWPPIKGADLQRRKMSDALDRIFLVNFFVGDRSLLVQNKYTNTSLDAMIFSFDVDYRTGHVGGGLGNDYPHDPDGMRPEDPGNIDPWHDATLIDPPPYVMMEEFFIELNESRTHIDKE